MKKKSINKLALQLIIPIIVLFSGVFFVWRWLTSPIDQGNQQLIDFTIEKGETIDLIGEHLQQENLIRSKALFKLTVLRFGLAQKIQAGEFFISPSWSLNQIVKTLTLGRRDIRVTLLEGWRREEFASELEKNFKDKSAEFNKELFLEITKDKEGYLFPDTYYLPINTNSQEIVAILLDNFNKQVDSQLREEIDKQGLTLEQVVILASLVEREAKFDADRPLVAGILIKRWQNDMALEVDATIQYALGYQEAIDSWWKKDLTRADLQRTSPYNTYLQTGLTPTPICNPSLASLKSVVRQKPSNFWFYLSDNQGKLHFAETLEKHNQNIATYLNK